MAEVFLEKNMGLGKKPLLFCGEMLYNKKNWVHLACKEVGTWQNSRKKQNVPMAAC
jgi:hypothetical protein